MVEIKSLYSCYSVDPLIAETLLSALNEAQVFNVQATSDGTFEFHELGSNFFGAALTREQLHQLADELKALADT